MHVYTPERVFARYGVTPEQVPDFIGLKDTSDNIPGVPGIGDKTAGQLIAQYGSLEGVLEHVDGSRRPVRSLTRARRPRRADRCSPRCAVTCRWTSTRPSSTALAARRSS